MLTVPVGCAATLDGLLLRVLPAVIYSIPFYPMTGFQSDPAHVALFFCVLAVFSATVGAMSMAITVGFGTAGKAALIMNLVGFVSMQVNQRCRSEVLVDLFPSFCLAGHAMSRFSAGHHQALLSAALRADCFACCTIPFTPGLL